VQLCFVTLVSRRCHGRRGYRRSTTCTRKGSERGQLPQAERPVGQDVREEHVEREEDAAERDDLPNGLLDGRLGHPVGRGWVGWAGLKPEASQETTADRGVLQGSLMGWAAAATNEPDAV